MPYDKPELMPADGRPRGELGPPPNMTAEQWAAFCEAARDEGKYGISAGIAALAAIVEGRAEAPKPRRVRGEHVTAAVVAAGATAAVQYVPALGTLGSVAVVFVVVLAGTALIDAIDRWLHPRYLPTLVYRV